MRATTFDNQFEAPSGFDPADFSKQMQRMAGQVDEVFATLTDWADHLTYQGKSELGTHVIMRLTSANMPATAPSIERTVTWDTTLIDNTGTVSGTGELYLPDQDQRYWWYIGANLLIDSASSLNVRETVRLWIQDSDPATGQLLTGAYRKNYYHIAGTALPFNTLTDGFFRTGGGRIRVTMSHSDQISNRSVLQNSIVWAIRICPDR